CFFSFKWIRSWFTFTFKCALNHIHKRVRASLWLRRHYRFWLRLRHRLRLWSRDRVWRRCWNGYRFGLWGWTWNRLWLRLRNRLGKRLWVNNWLRFNLFLQFYNNGAMSCIGLLMFKSHQFFIQLKYV